MRRLSRVTAIIISAALFLSGVLAAYASGAIIFN